MIYKSYNQMMVEALAFTEEMGLDTNDIQFTTEEYNIKDICFAIWFEFYKNRKLTIHNFIGQCFKRSLEVQSFLEKSLGLSSILTTGNIYIENKLFFNEDREIIKSRLTSNSSTNNNPQFHTWLTVSSYIIDVSLNPTQWYLGKVKENHKMENDSFYESPIFLRVTELKIGKVMYCPIFLGSMYFQRTNLL